MASNAITDRSDIQIREGTGAYSGRFEIYRRSNGERISDYSTLELAEKAIGGIRKYARNLSAARKEQDISVFTIRNTFMRPR